MWQPCKAPETLKPSALPSNKSRNASLHKFDSAGVRLNKEFQTIMSKFLVSLFLIAATFSVGLAQDQSQNPNDPPNMGRAPAEANGIGRLDARVVDEAGNPIKGAYAKLESMRTDGYFCESWNDTNEHGVAVLPPIHMGTLKLKVKAKGFKTIEIEVPASSLDQPVRVTMVRK
jgi:hypothetical protein